jgi:hypothetical protein
MNESSWLTGVIVDFVLMDGLGDILLDDGRTIRFGLSACGSFRPGRGAHVSVSDLKPGFGGRLKAGRVRPEMAQWPGVLVKVGELAEALCMNPATNEIVSVALTGATWASDRPQELEATVLCSIPGPQLQQRSSSVLALSAAPSPIPANAMSCLHREIGTRRALVERAERELRELSNGPIVALERRPTEFPYLCDGGAALEKYGLEGLCESCKRSPGRIYVPIEQSSDGSSEDPFFCDACIVAGKVVFYTPGDFEAYAFRAHPTDPIDVRVGIARTIADKLNRVPHVVVQCQYRDWPACCEEPTDYVGTPTNFASFQDFAIAAEWYERGRLFIEGESTERGQVGPVGVLGLTGSPPILGYLDTPETWEDVFCFQCAKCERRYFTWQFT